MLGPATAPVVLVAYGDYQCPDSARARPIAEIALHDRALRHRVIEDITGGLASGVSGTPTFFINGARYCHSWKLDGLAAAARDAGAIGAHRVHRGPP